MDKNILEIDEFREKAKDGQEFDDVMVRKRLEVETKVTDEENRVIEFIASTESRDRDGDTINPTGWKLGNFMNNPVFLWAHDYKTAPLGKVTSYKIEKDKLIEKVEFVNPEKMFPDTDYADLPEHVKFSDMIYKFYKNGTLNAVSVGFEPKEWEFSDEDNGNIDFMEQSQLELSAVPVPSNPEALMAASKENDGLVKNYAKQVQKWSKEVLNGLQKMIEEAREPNYEDTETTQWEDVDKTVDAIVQGYYAQNPDAEPESEEEIPGTVEEMPEPMKQYAASCTLLGDPEAEKMEDLFVLPVVNPSTYQLNREGLISANRLAPQLEASEDTIDSAQEMASKLLEDEFENEESAEHGVEKEGENMEVLEELKEKIEDLQKQVSDLNEKLESDDIDEETFDVDEDDLKEVITDVVQEQVAEKIKNKTGKII